MPVAKLIDGKNVSRAKMLLKVDCEFLRRSLPTSGNDDPFVEDARQLYAESVEAMKMVSFQRQSH